MALFLSTFINRVDRKGRVSVPSSYRSVLSKETFHGVVLYKSYLQPAVEAVAMSALERIDERLEHFALFSEEHDAMATVLFGESVQLPFDGEGRIVLPADFMAFAGITDQVAFVGLGQKFQLWQPDTLSERKETARRAVQEKGLMLPRQTVSPERGKP